MIPVIALVGRPMWVSPRFLIDSPAVETLVKLFWPNDRKYGEGEMFDRRFMVIDKDISGEEQGIDAGMAEQSLLAMDEADIVLFVVVVSQALLQPITPLRKSCDRRTPESIVIKLTGSLMRPC